MALLYPQEYADTLCAAVGMDSDTQARLAAARRAMTAHPDRELLAMKLHWRANAVRFQVSQGALALEYESHGPHPYTTTVLNVVRQARAMGLIVVISVQTEYYGCTPHAPDGSLSKLPSQDTIHAWRELAPTVRHDAGILLEIFNEPRTSDACHTSTEWSWPQWAYGCDANPKGTDGMINVAKAVRAMAPHNTLVLDGDNNAGKLNDFTPFPDTPANTAYAIHPYYYSDGPAGWDARFGSLQAQGQAVVATEWNAKCKRPDLARLLINHYLPDRHIGLFLHAWDAPTRTLITNLYDPVTSIGTCDFTGAPLAFQKFWTEAGANDPPAEIHLASMAFARGRLDAIRIALADNGSHDGSTPAQRVQSVDLKVRGHHGHERKLARMQLASTRPWTNGNLTLATATDLDTGRRGIHRGAVLIIEVRYLDGHTIRLCYSTRHHRDR